MATAAAGTTEAGGPGDVCMEAMFAGGDRGWSGEVGVAEDVAALLL